MNCSRTDMARQIDFSAVRNPDQALTTAILRLLGRRRDPMTERQISLWFHATPAADVEIQLVLMAGRGQIQVMDGARGTRKYWIEERS